MLMTDDNCKTTIVYVVEKLIKPDIARFIISLFDADFFKYY